MEKFVPYAKLSKKKKRELDARKRGTWGGLNPVTRKSPDPRAYNRRKARRQGFDEPEPCLFFFVGFDSFQARPEVIYSIRVLLNQGGPDHDRDRYAGAGLRAAG